MQYSTTPLSRLSSCQRLSSTCTASMSAMPPASSIWPTVTLHRPMRSIEPVALQRRERAHAGRERHARIGRVQLIEIDAIDAERRAAGRAGRDQVARAAVRDPAAVAGASARPWSRRRIARAIAASTSRARARSGVRCGRPRSSSQQYASAVSRNVTPASSAACRTAIARVVVALRLGREPHAAHPDRTAGGEHSRHGNSWRRSTSHCTRTSTNVRGHGDTEPRSEPDGLWLRSLVRSVRLQADHRSGTTLRRQRPATQAARPNDADRVETSRTPFPGDSFPRDPRHSDRAAARRSSKRSFSSPCLRVSVARSVHDRDRSVTGNQLD